MKQWTNKESEKKTNSQVKKNKHTKDERKDHNQEITISIKTRRDRSRTKTNNRYYIKVSGQVCIVWY